MSPDDPRHGKYAGYKAHRRAKEKVCEPCKEARRIHESKPRDRGPKPRLWTVEHAFPEPTEDDALTGGEWVNDRGVMRWQANSDRPVEIPESKPGRRDRAKCGTDGGYYRHLRSNPPEKACAECTDAHRVENRLRDARNRIKRAEVALGEWLESERDREAS